MDNLVIGNTSQLSKYFPEDYVKLSSRNIDKKFIQNKIWDRIFLCFGESRKFIKDDSLHDKINFEYTLDLIHFLLPYAKNIVIYSTCELWNKYYGSIDLNTPFSFYETNYIKSKFKLTNHVLNNDFYKKVIIIFPFNFNSIYRSQDFLFGKIFNSIINKSKIEIGNTYFHRDIIHPSYVVEQSILSENNLIVGSGRLIFVNDFIRDLYSAFGMNYNDFVVEKFDFYNEYETRNEYYLKSKKSLYTYNTLLNETINDIKNKILL
jgi:hypothetical protein